SPRGFMHKQHIRLALFAVLMLSLAAFAQKDKDKNKDAKNKDKDKSAMSSGSFHQVAKWDVGGDGGWDYFVYDTGGVHGIALAQDLGKAFISDGRDNAVTVVDLKTLKTLDKVSVSPATNPDAIMYEPSTKRVFTFNGRSKD